MAKTKITRKELLKKPDEFINFSARAINFARENSKRFSYLGIIILCILGIYLGINTYLKYINKKGQETFNIAYYTMIKNMGPNTSKAVLNESEELFRKVIDKYRMSKAARLTLPELGYIKFQDKRYDEAITQYQAFMDKLPKDDPYQDLAKLALAACYEEKGEFDIAIQELEQLVSGPEGFFKQQAMLSLARIYRTMGKPDKSVEILQQFVNQFQTSPFLPIAKAYLDS